MKTTFLLALLACCVHAQGVFPPSGGGLPLCSGTVTAGCQVGPNGSGVTIIPGTASEPNVCISTAARCDGSSVAAIWASAPGSGGAAKPTCSAANRGMSFLTTGATDVYQICESVSGTYTWVNH